MIVFHEGLPGSGKSYECMVNQIIPALKEGRKVYAYIEGMDHKKISSIVGYPPKVIESLLIQITREQVLEIYKHVENDSLVVIDELQNFWPAGRQKLPDQIMQFVTEHRHRGIDIIAMGQDLLDCHNLWRRRVQRKIIFQKNDMLGKDDEYRWTMYSAVKGAKETTFKKVRGDNEKYDSKYFGTYKSKVDDADNQSNLKDDRANIFKTKTFRYVIPAFIVVSAYSLYHVIGMFDSDLVVENQVQQTEQLQQTEQVTRESIKVRTTSDSVQNFSGNDPVGNAYRKQQTTINRDQSTDYIEQLSRSTRLRLSGYFLMKDRLYGQVEAIDDTLRVKETFTTDELIALGWSVTLKPYGLQISKDDTTLVVRSWPIEAVGRLPKKVANTL